ncbi:hypothetical protein C0213_03265 [Latilactobacillus sakei]|nr:hypothetical protein [Latilactobacillus sakei]AUX11465.1 hypothetical protein C0213_03265 [Latilactobacillus sakei]
MSDSKEKEKTNHDLAGNEYSSRDMEVWEYWANKQKGIRRMARRVIVMIVKKGEFFLLGAFINLFVDLAFISIHGKWFENSTNAAKGTIFNGDFRGNTLIGLTVFTSIIMGISFIAVQARSSEMVITLFRKSADALLYFALGSWILVKPWHNNYLLFTCMCIFTLVGSCSIAQIIIVLIRSTVSYVKSPVENEAVLKKMNFIWIVIAAIIGWMLKK